MILAEQGSALRSTELRQVSNAFFRALIPRRRPGRRPSRELDAAYQDWQAGVRGVTLYKQHIKGYAGMSRWRRRDETRKLMEGLRRRKRRERQAQQLSELTAPK